MKQICPVHPDRYFALIRPVTMHMPVQVLRPLVLILGSLAPPACKARVLTALSDMLVRWIRRAPLRRGGGTFFDENSEEDGDGEGGNVGGAGQEEAERVLLALDRMGVFALDSSEGHALVEMAVLDLYHKVLDAASAADAAESEVHGGALVRAALASPGVVLGRTTSR